MEQFTSVIERKTSEQIFERVTEHSREFDKETAETRLYSPEETRKAWQVREWKIGDTTIQAIGVSHVSETFLEFREEIEKVIEESDVVVNEFAPEAIGLYDRSSADRLRGIRSRFNENYDLEQLRQAYIKYERPWNLGLFHHEIELLAAKYGKDMATADLQLSKDPEAFLQDSYLYAYGAEQIAEQTVLLKKMGLHAGVMTLGIVGLGELIEALRKPMSRRQVLKLGLIAGAAVITGAASQNLETPPRIAEKKSMEMQDKSGYPTPDDYIGMLRDPKLAESLRQLAKAGYKKIALIYGANHLKLVEKYLDNPEMGTRELATSEEMIDRSNPDVLRVYRLLEGENSSEKFVASEKKIWKRVPI